MKPLRKEKNLLYKYWDSLNLLLKIQDESYFVPLSHRSRKIECNRAKDLEELSVIRIGIEIVSFNTSVISSFGVPISFPKGLERSTCVYRNWWYFQFLFIFVGHRHLSRYDAMDPTNASIINRTTTSSAAAMDYIKEPLASKYLRLIAYSVIFLLTITGNALVLAVVYKIRELHTGEHVILTVTS